MIKTGVDLRGLKPQMALAYAIVQAVFHRHGYTCVITSGSDLAPGRVPGSLHPLGLALDFRTHHVLRSTLRTLVEQVQEALGDQFDVVLEKDHLHVEWDPKEPVINPEER